MLQHIRKDLAQRRINSITRRLHTHITIQSFMDGFCEHPNWGLPAIQAIERIIGQGFASWEDIGCSRKELEAICYWQLRSLFGLLNQSFQPENAAIHWNLSRQAIYGLERFRRLEESHKELIQSFNYREIALAFQERTLALLHEERPDDTSDELNEYIRFEQAVFLTQGALWA